jgi:MFS family permease
MIALEPTPVWPRPAIAWLAVTLLMAANAFAVVDRVVIGLLVQPIEHDLGIGDAQIGLLQGFAFSLFYGGLGIPIGLLVDRWNRRNLVAIGIGLWSLATAACSLPGNFLSLFFTRMWVGVGEATLNPATGSLIADNFPPVTRPRAYGIYVMGSSIGTGVAFLMGAFALSAADWVRSSGIAFFQQMHTWQIVFIIVGAPGLILALIFRVAVREPVRHRWAIGDGEKATFGQAIAFMRRNPVAYGGLMLGCALNVMSIYAILAWYPTVFVRDYHWTAAEIGRALGTVGAPCGMVSAFSSGFIISWLTRRGRDDAPVLLAIAVTPGFLILGVASCLLPNAIAALACFVAMGIFTNWSSSAVLSGLNLITPNRFRGQVVALYFFFVGLIAVGLGPTSVGFLTDHGFGHERVDWALASVLAFASIAGAIILLSSRNAFRRCAVEALALSTGQAA